MKAIPNLFIFLYCTALATTGFSNNYEFNLAKTYSATKKKTSRKKRSSKSKGQKRTSSAERSNYLSGHGILNFLGSGIGLGYERSIKNYFSLGVKASYTRAYLEGTVGVNTNEVLDISGMRISGFGKFYFLKYGYASLNLNTSFVSGDYSLQEVSSPDSVSDVPFDSTEVHLDLTLGTQWNLRNHFFLAVDWVGIGSPLMSNTKTTSTTDNEQTVEFLTSQSSTERIRQEINQQLRLFYFTIHFGYKI